MLCHGRHLVVIESGAAHPRVVDGETERVHEVQRGTDVGAHADHVAGVRRDLRLIEDDVEHRRENSG